MEKVIEWRVDGCIGRICVANDPGWELHQLSCCQTLRHQKWTATYSSHKEERIEGMYWLWANIERLLSIGYWFGKSLQAMVFSWCKFQSSSQELCGSTNAEAGPRWKPVCIHLLIKQQHSKVCCFFSSFNLKIKYSSYKISIISMQNLQQAGFYKEESRVADQYKSVLVAGYGSVPIWHRDPNPGDKTALHYTSKKITMKNIKYFDIFSWEHL